ncbi:hypothetical protein ACFQ3Z_20740 [Streptomyces nogalater]
MDLFKCHAGFGTDECHAVGVEHRDTVQFLGVCLQQRGDAINCV